MEPLNSGDNLLEIWDNEQGWLPFTESYLTEATEYKLRYTGNQIDVRIQGVPLPFFQQQNNLYATLITPFQSGIVKVYINGQEYETFIYPDKRKLTEEQFELMLEEILDEANICFQLSGLETKVSVSGKSREISWTQWSYIERSFHKLKQIYTQIHNQPIRRLEKYSILMKREKVRHSEEVTLRWLDKQGHGDQFPTNVQSVKTLESIDVFENQVLKQQLIDLYRLLKKYEVVEQEGIKQKSKRYIAIVQGWLNSPFMNEITENKGPYTITQKFRKHPVYRMWYLWFDQLYKHKREGIGFDYPISLKDTFHLYEMWCYMKIVNILRESGLVRDTSCLFHLTKDGFFLNLAENKESEIKLYNGFSLYYQRTYQYNSKKFYTYTQRMIPDIVLEGEREIIIFDPKYRVPHNLGTALGEMHKYRDGIIHRVTGERAVREVFILTPTSEEQGEALRYFGVKFQEKYKVGAIRAVPASRNYEYLKKVIIECFNFIKKDT